MVNFRLMAATNWGMISSPDCTGVEPWTTSYKSGKRNGISPAPIQDKRVSTIEPRRRATAPFAMRLSSRPPRPETRASHV